MKKMLAVSVLSLFAFIGSQMVSPAAAAAAKGKKAGNLEAEFTHLDTNNDGFLSKEEFAKFGEGKKGKKAVDTDALFKKLDANNDGKLSKEEFLKAAEGAKAKKKKKNN